MKSALRPAIRRLLLIFLFSAPACAEDASPSPASESAVRAVMDAYVNAFNQRDVAALASKWREQGEFVNTQSGGRTVGRDAIANSFRTLFDERSDLSLGGQIHAIRWIHSDVAQVTGVAISVGDDDEPLESNFTAVLVHDGQAWLFDSIHETPLTPAPKASEQLESLEFLVGQWIDESDDVRVTTTIRWGVNRTFLIRSYTIERADSDVSQGTQVIGWDPRQERICCWTFDSDGSFGEGTWTSSEDGWKVKLTQTLTDGRVAGATQVITKVDDDTLTIQMVGQEVEGHTLPCSEPVRVIRISEETED